MKVVFSRFLGFLKYLLLVVSFALTFYGIIVTYRRLDKSLMDAISIFIPFILIFVVFVINLFIKSRVIRDNLLYNAVSILVFIGIIIIGYRAKFDTNMSLYYKYGINYNPAYLADNLSIVQVMLYTLAGSNVFLMISSIFCKDKKNIYIAENKNFNNDEKENRNYGDRFNYGSEIDEEKEFNNYDDEKKINHDNFKKEDKFYNNNEKNEKKFYNNSEKGEN